MKTVTVHLFDGVKHVFTTDYPWRDVADVMAYGCTVTAESGMKTIYPAKAVTKVDVE